MLGKKTQCRRCCQNGVEKGRKHDGEKVLEIFFCNVGACPHDRDNACASVGRPGSDNRGRINIFCYNGGSITINTDIPLTQPLQITNHLSIHGSGSLVVSPSWNHPSDAVIDIAANASLTIDGVKLDGGNRQNTKIYVKSALDVKGTLIMNGGSISHFVNSTNTSQRGIIHLDGGSFIMNGGSIEDNHYTDGYYQGIIYLCNGASFEMNDGTVANNSVADPQGASGIVNVSNHGGKNVFTMKGGDLKENKSSAVFVGSLTFGRNERDAVFMLEDGAIINNADASKGSYFAGGIYVNNGTVIMNGGTIAGNKGLYYGGGVSVLANPGGTFEMYGGTIARNESMYGGGLFVNGIIGQDWQASIQLHGGTIEENVASRQGGGIYVVRGQEINLYNVLITENTATKIGGGIWTCSTGELKVYVTNGGAVFGNTAAGDSGGSAGSDFAFVQHTDDVNEFILSKRMIGGGLVDYYRDGGVYTEDNAGSEGSDGQSGEYYLGVADGSARFNPNNPGEKVAVNNLENECYALVSVASENAKRAADDQNKLIIRKNRANRGAGVGSNGSVIIGDVPIKPDYRLDVVKKWDENTPEDIRTEVEVALVSEGYVLDSVKLNAGNHWKASFSDLPKGDYQVKELNVSEGIKTTYSDVILDEGARLYQVTVTNTFSDPQAPDATDAPEAPNATDAPEAIDLPPTGDRTGAHIYLFIGLMMLSVIGLCVTCNKFMRT